MTRLRGCIGVFSPLTEDLGFFNMETSSYKFQEFEVYHIQMPYTHTRQGSKLHISCSSTPSLPLRHLITLQVFSSPQFHLFVRGLFERIFDERRGESRRRVRMVFPECKFVTITTEIFACAHTEKPGLVQWKDTWLNPSRITNRYPVSSTFEFREIKGYWVI